MKNFLFPFFLLAGLPAFVQSYVTRDIKSFGAKGNGRVNDHEAFLRAAAFFNQRGGHGKLVISKGTYLVGKQRKTDGQKNKPYYEGIDLMHFSGVADLTVEGKGTPLIQYMPSLFYGTFEPGTGEISKKSRDFYDYSYAAIVGNAVSLTNCANVRLSRFELNGNNTAFVLGGAYGDVGRQLPHSGIVLENSTKVTVTDVKANHFGLDGITIVNPTGDSVRNDAITLTNCVFEYNGRQGLSWVGGNDLTAVQCHFNHTGKSKFYSPPGAGVDIEAEVGTVKNGKFIRCEFADNAGCGMVADSGPSSNCTFTNCTFWGTTSWSVWINKPSFVFNSCNIYGSIVHGYHAATDGEATAFLNCHFEDKTYNGQPVYGEFLIETNFARRMLFENCTMVAHRKKIAWFGAPASLTPDEKYQIVNCYMTYDGDHLPEGDFAVLLRGVRLKNSTLRLINPVAKTKRYYFEGMNQGSIDAGGNKFLYQ